jgi:hypothetical protein
MVLAGAIKRSQHLVTIALKWLVVVVVVVVVRCLHHKIQLRILYTKTTILKTIWGSEQIIGHESYFEVGILVSTKSV